VDPSETGPGCVRGAALGTREPGSERETTKEKGEKPMSAVISLQRTFNIPLEKKVFSSAKILRRGVVWKKGRKRSRTSFS